MNHSIMDPMIPHPYKIQRVIKETHDTFTLELKSIEKNGTFSFAPGQFNMLYIAGIGEVPISISGNPTKNGSLIHTTRAVGTVTKEMAKLKRSDVIGIRGPFGTNWPVKEAEGNDVLLVAGGIGLAPLRPVIYHILSKREYFGKIILLYGTRTPQDILFRKELEKLKSRLDIDIYVTVDRATRAWNGNVGVVTRLIPRAPFDPINTIAMICGPEIMMRYTITEISRRGIASENIYVSVERNMKCGIGLCGHCLYGTEFICKDGPVFRYDQIQNIFGKREF
ncbi:MAG: Ni/Fe hydrogenase subunit gamma [Ignavibacteria bacterium]|nr:Ni/Fe hydrogenase subunit gamma [Ignavibacteria bacterium]